METKNVIQHRINRISSLLQRLEQIPAEIEEIMRQFLSDISAGEFSRLVSRRNNLLMEQLKKQRELAEVYHFIDFDVYDELNYLLDEEIEEELADETLWQSSTFAQWNSSAVNFPFVMQNRLLKIELAEMEYESISQRIDRVQQALYRPITRQRFSELVVYYQKLLKRRGEVEAELKSLQELLTLEEYYYKANLV